MNSCFRLCFLFFVISTSSAFAAEVGVVSVVIGKVEVMSNEKPAGIAARAGQKIFSGDTVITGPGSKAHLQMNDTNSFDVGSDSRLKIVTYEGGDSKSLKKVEMNLDFGLLRSTVNQNYGASENTFRVRTPSAVAGVRGTDFLVTFDKASGVSEVVTFKGDVEVGSHLNTSGAIDSSVRVRAGDSVQVRTGDAPGRVEKLPAGRLERLRAETITREIKDSEDKSERRKSSDEKKEPARKSK